MHVNPYPPLATVLSQFDSNWKNIGILHWNLKMIPYICSMVTNTFIYYKHFEEINKFLMYAYFIDGETYQIEVLDGKKFVYGNFLINYNIGGGYEDRIVPEGFPIDDTELRKMLEITQPLKFEQIR